MSSIGKNSCSIVGLVPDLFVSGVCPLALVMGSVSTENQLTRKENYLCSCGFNSCLLGCFCSSKFGFCVASSSPSV